MQKKDCIKRQIKKIRIMSEFYYKTGVLTKQRS